MDVKKIFIVLITVVACVVIGAVVLNVLIPNGTNMLINAIEQLIFNATGLSFDINGDSTFPGAGGGTQFGGDDAVSGVQGADVGGMGVEGMD